MIFLVFYFILISISLQFHSLTSLLSWYYFWYFFLIFWAIFLYFFDFHFIFTSFSLQIHFIFTSLLFIWRDFIEPIQVLWSFAVVLMKCASFLITLRFHFNFHFIFTWLSLHFHIYHFMFTYCSSLHHQLCIYVLFCYFVICMTWYPDLQKACVIHG